MTKSAPPLQILLAEDSVADIGIVRVVIEEQHLDCGLHIAYDGAEAMEYIENMEKNPKSPGLDLLLLDMHLPKHGGEDILRFLRSTERGAHTPVIVLTGSDAPKDREQARKHDAVCYFRKPSRLAEFMELGKIVRDILTGNRSRPKRTTIARTGSVMA